MADSYDCENSLRTWATKLREEAAELERAADVLAILRSANKRSQEIAAAKRWAKDWMR